MSAIGGESEEWIELFTAWVLSGRWDIRGMAARDAEALLLLEQEWRKETGSV